MTACDTGADAVIACGLGKSFGAFYAVQNLSFSIKSGECFGLLGPNGAGKSTLIKMIYGVLARSHGDLSVLGLDPSRDPRILRRRIGVVMQEDALDDAMNVRDNMMMFCLYHQIKKQVAVPLVDELLEFMGLTSKAKARIGTLSGGMRRRLAFVRALIPSPKLLILDEPTTGLDPAVRQLLWQKIADLKRRGTTIILTTHYMEEAELLCDRLILIDGGAVQEAGSPKDLIERHSPGYVALFLDTNSDSGHQRVQRPTLEDIAKFVHERGEKPEMVRPSSLEDVFLKLTGKALNG